ncbi:MAG: hypothetical protein M3Q51_04725 [Pseudomonadota bacterium]|nr:hypothetical protein [Pseudomonadota bacterium]
MSNASASVGAGGRAREQSRSSPFFLILGLLLLLLAIAGFWPQYFSAITGKRAEPLTHFWLIHLHAGLFIGWLLVYIAQATLILTGRTRTHLRMGPWLGAYGFAAAAVGMYAAASLAHRLGVRENDVDAAAAFVFFPVIDMVFFAGFLAAALVFRKRADLHKRAMFVASFSIAVVGLGRLIGQAGLENPWLWQPLNLSPLLLAMAYDAVVFRKLHRVMVVAVIVHVARLNAEPFAAGESWLRIGRFLISPFG